MYSLVFVKMDLVDTLYIVLKSPHFSRVRYSSSGRSSWKVMKSGLLCWGSVSDGLRLNVTKINTAHYENKAILDKR